MGCCPSSSFHASLQCQFYCFQLQNVTVMNMLTAEGPFSTLTLLLSHIMSQRSFLLLEHLDAVDGEQEGLLIVAGCLYTIRIHVLTAILLNHKYLQLQIIHNVNTLCVRHAIHGPTSYQPMQQIIWGATFRSHLLLLKPTGPCLASECYLPLFKPSALPKRLFMNIAAFCVAILVL